MSARTAGVFLFTNKSLDITPIHEWFKDRLDDIAIVTEQALVEEFSQYFAEVHGIDDYFDDASFHAAAGAALRDRACPVQALCYLVEVDVDRCGLLRDQYGIPGMSHADALMFRNKHLMKQRLSGHVKTPRFRLVQDAQSLAAFADEVGYPVVVKPLNKFGSVAVTAIRSTGEIPIVAAPMLAEEFIDGGMYHVDGFMRAGLPFASTVSLYKNGCLAFGEGRPLGSYQLDETGAEHGRVMAFTRTVLQALPHTIPCLFHLEVFVRPDGELLFCEIAARMGGGHIYDVLNATLGADVVKLWVAAQMGLDWFDQLKPVVGRRHGFLLVPPVEGFLKQVRPVELPAYVMRSSLPQEVPKRYERAAMSVDRLASFVVHGDNASEVAARLDYCEELVRQALVWE